jgi:hypothetical protein
LGISRVEFWRFFDVSANTAVAIFRILIFGGIRKPWRSRYSVCPSTPSPATYCPLPHLYKASESPQIYSP